MPYDNRQELSIFYVRAEGCGNTFLIFDCLDIPSENLGEVLKIAHRCLIKEDRDDALILTTECETSDSLLLRMIVLEPDGSIAEFCGNGARAVGCYLKERYGHLRREYYLDTSRGKKRIWWNGGSFHVDMGKTMLHLNKSKFLQRKFETFMLGLGVRQFTFFWTETIEPHLVTFDPISDEELHNLGLHLNQQRNYFPLGINLNKAEIASDTSLKVTTFERGVNRITAACGTGATSCAILARATGRLASTGEISVCLKGGSVTVKQIKGKAILSGPAKIEKGYLCHVM